MGNTVRNGRKVTVYSNYQDNEWDSGLEFVSSCGKCKNGDYRIGMRPIVKMKIDALMEEYPRIEWLAYLIGFIDHERGYAEITDLAIPDSQEISAVSVDEVLRDFDAIGVIHSHHTMNFGFSKTDWEYVNSNNDISIVVYNSGKNMECSMRIQADCGAMTFIKPDLRIVFNDEFDKDSFIEDAKSKIRWSGIGEFNYYSNYYYGGRDRYPYSVPRNNQRVNNQTSKANQENEIPSEYEEIMDLYRSIYGEDLWEEYSNYQNDNAFDFKE